MQRSFAHAPLRALLSLLSFLIVLGGVAFTAPALAEDKKIETAAKDALKKVEDDFLSGDYAKAIDKLKKAADACGADKCTPATKAQLFRDLGAMYFYAKKKDDATNAFVEALKIEPDASLNMNYKTPDVDAVYADAKKKVPAGGGVKPPPDGGGTDVPSGDFKHDAPTEQAVRTPLPIYVTYGGSSTIAKVIVKYKGFGMSEFKPVELSKMGDGWGGLVPCADVTQGTMQYYIQGFDASNDPVATSGDRNKPYKVAIKSTIDGEAPHLPGASPPKQCQETGDCPPDFPGCKKGGGDTPPDNSSKKEEGDECEEDNQCKSDKCTHSKCAAGEGDSKTPSTKFRRVWIGIAGSLDWDIVPSDSDVCKLDPKSATPGYTGPVDPANPNGAHFASAGSYYCTQSDGTDFPLRSDKGAQNNLIKQGSKDQVAGGGNIGNFRVMLTLDYALNANLLLGVRFGYVLNTYNGKAADGGPGAASNDGKTFIPLHLEVRGTYLIGKDALAKPGFAPMVFLGAGASQFDSKVDVSVVSTAGPSLPVSAWALGGPAFVALGGGGRFAFSNRAAAYGALKLTGAFGGQVGFLPVLGPEVGLQFGF